MPNRILKESVCTSDSIDSLSLFSEIFFYRLIVNCDDYGRMDARPRILSSKLFPLKDVQPEDVVTALKQLEKANLITLYMVDERPYLQMKTWDKHQQVRARRSKYPSSDDCNLQSNDINCNQMISDDSKCSRNPIQSESLSESESLSLSESILCHKKETRTRKNFVPPTVEDVQRYCDEREVYLIDPERFVDYYKVRDWELSKGRKMKDWKAAVRLWERNEQEKRAKQHFEEEGLPF